MNPTLSKSAANLKRRARKADKTLPSVWLMSDEARLPDPLAACATLPRGAAVILRHYTAPDRRSLAKRLAALCRARGLVLIVAGDWRLATEVGAAGFHLADHAARRGPSAGARLWRRRTRRLLTVAAHSDAAIRRAQVLEAAAVLLSPVFVTVSHPERPALAQAHIAAVARTTPIPVIALGGITMANISRLRDSGCAGIAGIGFALSK